MNHMSQISRVGRPLFDGKPLSSVLQKLEEAFMLSATDQEACIYVGISPSALYEYQKKNPEFLERKQALKNMPSLRAKKAIVDRLDKDVALAQWWLTRRNKAEFGEEKERLPQQPIQQIDFTEEARKRLAKYNPAYRTPATTER